MRIRARTLGFTTAVVATLLSSIALSQAPGVGARLVEVLERPGKQRIKVILGGPGAENIQKGPAGDPSLLRGEMAVCIDSGFAPFITGPWRKNSENVATFRSPPGVSLEGSTRKVTVKPGKSLVWITDTTNFLGVSTLPSPPMRGGLQITIGDQSRLCVNLESAQSLEDRSIANGAGRRIVWRNVAPDPGCEHFDFLLQSICA
jgi:hypothetical protein